VVPTSQVVTAPASKAGTAAQIATRRALAALERLLSIDVSAGRLRVRTSQVQ
jgi:hypothetical protein